MKKGENKTGMVKETIDRISNLPNPILHHILSLLSTKEAVRTSVLAKRWVNLWATLPSLVLNSRGNEDNFGQFVNRILSFRGSWHLDSFKISCKAEPKVFKSWLLHVVKLQPRSLSMVSGNLPLVLPGSVFRCESLEKLSLCVPHPGIEPVPVLRPKLISLSRLKYLEISGEVRVDDQFMTQLMSNCTMLENLCLSSCKLELSVISSHVLKELYIAGCDHDEMIYIHTPNLLHLDLSGFCGGFEFKGRMKSLETAKISFGGFLYEQDYLWGDLDEYTGVLEAVSNVTNLELHGEEVLAFLQKELFCAYFVFDNLRSFYCWTDDTFYPIIRFLDDHAFYLEKLTLNYEWGGCISSGRGDDYYDSRPVVLSFNCSYLEKIEIIGSKYDTQKLIEQILKSNGNRDTKIVFV